MSDITVSDMFCGAGGSSQGAEAAGATLRLALNHWTVAIETHNLNFPHADHALADVSSTDPRRFPSTTILIASPECTEHSQANGKRKPSKQIELLPNGKIDPGAERSRATMWDVPRFAEVHGYQAIVVENVVEVYRWVMFDAWLMAMHSLGYEHRLLSLNSMHTGRVPQSRDRLYGVFWRKGNRTPDLDIRPRCLCPEHGEVRGIHTWKRPGQQVGKFGSQYVYRCPEAGCVAVVTPVVRPALDALDFSIPSPRIGDRKKPLAEKTLARAAVGILRWWPVTLLTAAGNTYESGNYRRVYDPLRPMPTQTTTVEHGVAYDPLLVDVDRPGGGHLRPASQPLATQTGRHVRALVSPPLIAELRGGGSTARPVNDPMSTVSAGGNHHALLMRNNSGGAEMSTPVTEPMRTVTTKGHQSLLMNYNGNGGCRPVDEPILTLPTKDRFGLVTPEGMGETLDLDDVLFRMLEPSEIHRGMAFSEGYVVTGTKRDQVRQYGGAVTPPVMQEIVGRLVETLR